MFVSDNGMELTSIAILRWSQETRIEWYCAPTSSSNTSWFAALHEAAMAHTGRAHLPTACPLTRSDLQCLSALDGRKADPPICTPFYAIALPPVEGTLHTPRIARRSVLRATREHGHRRASEPVTKGSTEQPHGSENRRPNYAVAAGCPLTPTRSSPAALTSRHRPPCSRP
jgi:hypothetical protein